MNLIIKYQNKYYEKLQHGWCKNHDLFYKNNLSEFYKF